MISAQTPSPKITATRSSPLLLILFFMGTATHGQMNKIVFVCEHGAAKSVIAADYFNKMAKERGLPWEATCRATAPDSALSPATRAGFRNDNITPNRSPQKISLQDTAHVKRIILFTPLPPGFKTNIKINDWSSIRNIDADYPKRKDAIINQINILLDSLENR